VDEKVQLVTRIDMNVSSGVLRAVRELLITKIVIGWNGRVTAGQRIFGSILDNLLAQSYQAVYVCKLLHPLSTMNRMVVAVPANAGLEKGFSAWVLDLHRMAKQIGVSMTIYADADTRQRMETLFLPHGAQRGKNLPRRHRLAARRGAGRPRYPRRPAGGGQRPGGYALLRRLPRQNPPATGPRVRTRQLRDPVPRADAGGRVGGSGQ
jgi:hypothetical protein